MYRHIALIALLLPFFGYGVNKDSRIKELREAQFQKTLELKNICKQANDCAEFLISSGDYYNCPKQSPESEALNEIFLNKIRNTFTGLGSFDYDLTKELFDQNDADSINSFDVLKGLYMRAATERQLLALLIARYQVILKELFKITQELASLE
ncbi:hypothetical protein JST99_02065 [Candidatus Dependentiae bacterium]|nr:hypothetical protein [Candidatus Dependentiae bacterium]